MRSLHLVNESAISRPLGGSGVGRGGFHYSISDINIGGQVVSLKLGHRL